MTQEFTPKQISQMVDMTHEWCAGFCRPIDLRKWDKAVVEWALGRRLLVRQCKHGASRYLYGFECPEGKNCKYADTRIYYSRSNLYRPGQDLPVEAVWKIVDGMIGNQNSKGFTRKTATGASTSTSIRRAINCTRVETWTKWPGFCCAWT